MTLPRAQDACDAILHSIKDAVKNSTPLQSELAFDHIMCSGPYRCLIESLFASDDGRQAPEIPVICRRYEESYMRGPLSKEDPLCVMGKQCECMQIDEARQFVGVRFVLPVPTAGQDNLCVLCHRRLVQDLFYDLLYTGRPFRGLIQKYGVICGENGEYCIDDLLICPAGGPIECFPLPSVVHQRNRYRVVVRNNVHYVQQQLQTPSGADFRPPSP